MKKKIALVITCGAALMLAGCGSTGDAGGNGSSDTGQAKATNVGWDATDACALLDKSAVGAALKDEVTEASVALVHQASGAEAATSECTYMLAGGSRASLMARNSPIADNTDEAMTLARKATEQSMAAFSNKKIEDVPGLGKSAFFVPGINQLNVFDDRKFVILTISSAPDATAKATAVELVGKIKT